MKSTVHVAAPPSRLTLIFDGDCNFCRAWISRWQQTTGDRVAYIPFQDPQVKERFPELPREHCERAVQLIETDGSVFAAAEAALRSLATNPRRRWLLNCYQRWPAIAGFCEWFYRLVARNRMFFSRLTRLGWGRHVERPSHRLTRWVFLRCLALIYLAAFVSLWVQIKGLAGNQGILPAKDMMDYMRQQADAKQEGWQRYFQTPTFCWWSESDRSLQIQCAGGTALSLLLLAGITPAPCLFLLWLIYLSLTTVCGLFLGYQWDNLLLETGLLAIFLAPLRLWDRPSPAALSPSRLVIWLFRWLLFRLMFESGCVKLLSGDSTWHGLTALTFHYETQCLPTWIGWYAHQLPVWVQKVSVVLMFGIELVLPFFIFLPRRPRFCAAAGFIALQVLIFSTGNYCYFNLLTIALCVLLLDDTTLMPWIPARWRGKAGDRVQGSGFAGKPLEPDGRGRLGWWFRLLATVPLAGLIAAISLSQLWAMFHRGFDWPRALIKLHQWVGPLRSFNSYGLFAAMTRPRYEIVVEGSDDGQVWYEYEFKYKPGDVKRRPVFVAPHQPRLDWQMWFAALGSVQQNRWFVEFCVRLLQGTPEVVALLERNPFPKAPPRYIRARLYEYHFTTFGERRKTGAWWRRELKGAYMPAISLRQ